MGGRKHLVKINSGLVKLPPRSGIDQLEASLMATPCRFSRILPLLISTILLVCVYSSGQSDTAMLSGRVVDPSGLNINGAQVELVNVDRNVTATTKTNKTGLYTFPSVQPGHYRMRISAPDFTTVNLTSLTLSIQDSREQNFRLALGSVTESVTVEAHSNLVDVSNAVSTHVDQQFVKELPLNGRSFQTLFQLTPGVVITSTTPDEQGQFSVNGQRANANYFTIDGVGANVGAQARGFNGQATAGSLPALTVGGGTNGLVSVDAMQEFSIQTSGYAPEYGRTPGGQISILTRSGTDELHGDVFDYLRNDDVDANDWFANHNHLKRAKLRQNDFGGVLGGPIIRDKTFFFVSYEGLRLRQPRTGTADVPSLATRQAAVPSMQPYVDAFPLPTGPDEGNGLSPAHYTYSDPSRLDTESLRIDHLLNRQFTMFARYNRSTSSSGVRSGALSTVANTVFKLETATLGFNWAIRPTVNNDLHFNWSWSAASAFFTLDSLGGAVPLSPQNVFPNNPGPANSVLELFVVTGNNTTLSLGPSTKRNLQRQFNLVDSFSWQFGDHLLKLGADYRRLTPEQDAARYQVLPFFLAASDLDAGTPGIGVGLVGIYGPISAVYDNYSLFVQDTWRTTRRMTLTYGLRWDYNPTPSGHGANGLPALTVVGVNNLSTASPAPSGIPYYHATLDNLAPRVGLAYNVRDSKDYGAILRAGFGVFFDMGNGPIGNIFTGPSFQNSVFPVVSTPNFPLPPSQAVMPPPALNPPFLFLYAFPPTLRQPYTYHWDLAYEQSIGDRQALTMSYVGAAGHSQLRQDTLGGVAINPDVGQIFYVNNAGYSNYNSLQLGFRRRQARGLEILAAYAYSHSLDNVSADSQQSTPTIQFSPSRDYGPSDFDIRHTGSVAIDYQPPSPVHSGWARAALSGWGFNTLLVGRTSTPVNVVINQDLGFGSQNYRPDIVPGAPLYIRDSTSPGGRRINPAAFAVPAAPTQGDLARNALRGFPLFQQDISVRRSFHITEKFTLQARVEAFNILNHPNFAPPLGTLGFVSGGTLSPMAGFGMSQSMFNVGAGSGGNTGGFNPLYQIGGPRSLQAALKLEF